MDPTLNSRQILFVEVFINIIQYLEASQHSNKHSQQKWTEAELFIKCYITNILTIIMKSHLRRFSETEMVEGYLPIYLFSGSLLVHQYTYRISFGNLFVSWNFDAFWYVDLTQMYWKQVDKLQQTHQINNCQKDGWNFKLVWICWKLSLVMTAEREREGQRKNEAVKEKRWTIREREKERKIKARNFEGIIDKIP